MISLFKKLYNKFKSLFDGLLYQTDVVLKKKNKKKNLRYYIRNFLIDQTVVFIFFYKKWSTITTIFITRQYEKLKRVKKKIIRRIVRFWRFYVAPIYYPITSSWWFKLVVKWLTGIARFFLSFIFYEHKVFREVTPYDPMYDLAVAFQITDEVENETEEQTKNYASGRFDYIDSYEDDDEDEDEDAPEEELDLVLDAEITLKEERLRDISSLEKVENDLVNLFSTPPRQFDPKEIWEQAKYDDQLSKDVVYHPFLMADLGEKTEEGEADIELSTEVIEHFDYIGLDYRFFNEETFTQSEQIVFLNNASLITMPTRVKYYFYRIHPKSSRLKALNLLEGLTQPLFIKRNWVQLEPEYGVFSGRDSRINRYLLRKSYSLDFWKFDPLNYYPELSSFYSFEEFLTRPFYEELFIKDKYLDIKKFLNSQDWNVENYFVVKMLVFPQLKKEDDLTLQLDLMEEETKGDEENKEDEFDEEGESFGDLATKKLGIDDSLEKAISVRESRIREEDIFENFVPFLYKEPTQLISLLQEKNIQFFLDYNLEWYHRLWKINHFSRDIYWNPLISRSSLLIMDEDDYDVLNHSIFPIYRTSYIPILEREKELVMDNLFQPLSPLEPKLPSFVTFIGYLNKGMFINVAHPYWIHEIKAYGLSPLDLDAMPMEISDELDNFIEWTRDSERVRSSFFDQSFLAFTRLFDYDKEVGLVFTGTLFMIIHLFPPFFPMFRKFYLGINPWHMDYIPINKFYRKTEVNPFGPAQLEFLNFGYARDHSENLSLWYKRRIYSLWHKRRWKKYINRSEPKFFQSHDKFRKYNNLYYKRYYNLPKILRFSVNSYPTTYGFAYSPERLFRQHSEDISLYTNRHSLFVSNPEDLKLLRSEFPFSNYSDFTSELGYYTMPSDLGAQGFMDLSSQIIGPTINNLEILKLWSLQYRLGLFHLHPWVSEEMQSLLSTVIPTLSFWRSHAGRRRYRRLFYKRRFQFVPFNHSQHPKLLAFFYPFFINNNVQRKRGKFFTNLVSKSVPVSYSDYFYSLLSYKKLAESLHKKHHPTLFPFIFSNFLFPNHLFSSPFKSLNLTPLLKNWKMRNLVSSSHPLKSLEVGSNLIDFENYFRSSNYYRSVNNHFKRVTASFYWDKTGVYSKKQLYIKNNVPFQTIYSPSKLLPRYLASNFILRKPIIVPPSFSLEKAWPSESIFYQNLLGWIEGFIHPWQSFSSLFLKTNSIFNFLPSGNRDPRPLIPSDKDLYLSDYKQNVPEDDPFIILNPLIYTIHKYYKSKGLNIGDNIYHPILAKLISTLGNVPNLTLQSFWDRLLTDPKYIKLLSKNTSSLVSKLPLGSIEPYSSFYIKPHRLLHDRIRTRSFFFKNKVKSKYLDFLFTQRQRKRYLNSFFSFFPKWLQRLSHNQKIFLTPDNFVHLMSGLKGSRSYDNFFSSPFQEKYLYSRPSIYNYYWGRGRMKRSFFRRINGITFRHLRRQFYNPEVGRKAMVNLAPFFANERELARLHPLTHVQPQWWERYLFIPPQLWQFPPIRKLKERFNIFFADKYKNYFLEDYYLKHYKSPISIIRQAKGSPFARRYHLNYLRKSDFIWNGANKHLSFLDPQSQQGIDSIYNWDEISSAIEPYFKDQNWYSKVNQRSPLFLGRRLFNSNFNKNHSLKFIFPNSVSTKNSLPWKESDFMYGNRYLARQQKNELNPFFYPLRFGIRSASGPNVYSSRLFYLPQQRPVSMFHMRKRKLLRNWISFKLRKNFFTLSRPVFEFLNKIPFINILFAPQRFSTYEDRFISRNRMVRTTLRRMARGRHIRSPNHTISRFRNDLRNAHDFLLNIPSFLPYRMKRGHIYSRSLLNKLLNQLKQAHMTQVDSFVRSLTPKWKRLSFINNTRTLFSRLQHQRSYPISLYEDFLKDTWDVFLNSKAFHLPKNWAGIYLYHNPLFFSDKKRRFRKLGVRGYDLLAKKSKVPSSYSYTTTFDLYEHKKYKSFLTERNLLDMEPLQWFRYFARTGSSNYPLTEEQAQETIPDFRNFLYLKDVRTHPFKYHYYTIRRRPRRFLKKNWTPRTNYYLNNSSRAIHPRIPFETHLNRFLYLYGRKEFQKAESEEMLVKLRKFFKAPLEVMGRTFFSSTEAPNEINIEKKKREERKKREAEAKRTGKPVPEIDEKKEAEEARKKAEEERSGIPKSANQQDLPYSFDREQFFHEYVGLGFDAPVGIRRAGTGRDISNNSLLFYLFGSQKRHSLAKFRHISLRKKYQYWFNNTPHSSQGESYLDAALRFNLNKYYDLDSLRSSYLGKHHSSVSNKGPLRSYWRKNNYSRPLVQGEEDDVFRSEPSLYAPYNFSYSLSDPKEMFRSIFLGANRNRKSAWPLSNLSFPIRNDITDLNSLRKFHKLGIILSKSNSSLFKQVSSLSFLDKYFGFFSDYNKLNLVSFIKDRLKMYTSLQRSSYTPTLNYLSLLKKRETNVLSLKPSIKRKKKRLLPWKEIELQLQNPFKYNIRKSYERAMYVPSIFNYLSIAVPKLKYEFPRRFVWKKRILRPYLERDYERFPHDWIDWFRDALALEVDTDFSNHSSEVGRDDINFTPMDNRLDYGVDFRHFYHNYASFNWARHRRNLAFLSRKNLGYFEKEKLRRFIHYPKKFNSKKRMERLFSSSNVFHRKWIESFYLRKLRKFVYGKIYNDINYSKYSHEYPLHRENQVQKKDPELLKEVSRSSLKRTSTKRHSLWPWSYYDSVDSDAAEGDIYGPEHDFEYKTNNYSAKWNRQFARYSSPFGSRYQRWLSKRIPITYANFKKYVKLVESKVSTYYVPRLRRSKKSLFFHSRPFIRKRLRNKIVSPKIDNPLISFIRTKKLFYFLKSKELESHTERALYLFKRRLYRDSLSKKNLVMPLLSSYNSFSQKKPTRNRYFLSTPARFFSFRRYFRKSDKLIRFDKKQLRKNWVQRTRGTLNVYPDPATRMVKSYTSFDSFRKVRKLKHFFSFNTSSTYKKNHFKSSLSKINNHRSTYFYEPSLNKNNLELEHQRHRISDFSAKLEALSNEKSLPLHKIVLSPVFYKRLFFDYQKKNYSVPEFHPERRSFQTIYTPMNIDTSLGVLEPFVADRSFRLREQLNRLKNLELLNSISDSNLSLRSVMGRGALKLISTKYHSRRRKLYKDRFLTRRFLYPNLYELPRFFSFLVPKLPIPAISNPKRYFYNSEIVSKKHLSDNYVVSRTRGEQPMAVAQEFPPTKFTFSSDILFNNFIVRRTGFLGSQRNYWNNFFRYIFLGENYIKPVYRTNYYKMLGESPFELEYQQGKTRYSASNAIRNKKLFYFQQHTVPPLTTAYAEALKKFHREPVYDLPQAWGPYAPFRRRRLASIEEARKHIKRLNNELVDLEARRLLYFSKVDSEGNVQTPWWGWWYLWGIRQQHRIQEALYRTAVFTAESFIHQLTGHTLRKQIRSLTEPYVQTYISPYYSQRIVRPWYTRLLNEVAPKYPYTWFRLHHLLGKPVSFYPTDYVAHSIYTESPSVFVDLALPFTYKYATEFGKRYFMPKPISPFLYNPLRSRWNSSSSSTTSPSPSFRRSQRPVYVNSMESHPYFEAPNYAMHAALGDGMYDYLEGGDWWPLDYEPRLRLYYLYPKTRLLSEKIRSLSNPHYSPDRIMYSNKRKNKTANNLRGFFWRYLAPREKIRDSMLNHFVYSTFFNPIQFYNRTRLQRHNELRKFDTYQYKGSLLKHFLREKGNLSFLKHMNSVRSLLDKTESSLFNIPLSFISRNSNFKGMGPFRGYSVQHPASIPSSRRRRISAHNFFSNWRNGISWHFGAATYPRDEVRSFKGYFGKYGTFLKSVFQSSKELNLSERNLGHLLEDRFNLFDWKNNFHNVLPARAKELNMYYHSLPFSEKDFPEYQRHYLLRFMNYFTNDLEYRRHFYFSAHYPLYKRAFLSKEDPERRFLRMETDLGLNFLLDPFRTNRAFVPSNAKKLSQSFLRFYKLSQRFFSFKTHYYSLKRWYFVYGNKKVGSYSLLSWRTHRKALSDYFYLLDRFKFKYQDSKNQFFNIFENSVSKIPSSFVSLKIKYGSFLKDRVKKEFLLQSRASFLEKKAIVVVARNLVRERRNLQYKESYRKYKPYFIKPVLSWKDNYSNYIDFIHERHLIPLFNIKKELQTIKENKKLLLEEPNLPPEWIYANFIVKKLKFVFNFYHDFYYDVVVDFYIWFPFYDFYNALSFFF